MAEIVENYFQAGWRTRAIACVCGWRGDSRTMVMQLHEEVTDYACPDCENTLLIVSHPDIEKVEVAAVDGNAEAQQQLALVEEALAAQRNSKR